jgi:hypothetical protein
MPEQVLIHIRLARALAAKDWPTVELCRYQIRDLDA